MGENVNLVLTLLSVPAALSQICGFVFGQCRWFVHFFYNITQTANSMLIFKEYIAWPWYVLPSLCHNFREHDSVS